MLRHFPVVGVVLMILGAASMSSGHFSYHIWDPAVDVGSIHLAAHLEHRVSIPTVSGILMLLAGVGLIAVRWQKT